MKEGSGDNSVFADIIRNESEASLYTRHIGEIRAETTGAKSDGMVMQKKRMNSMDKMTSHVNGINVDIVVVIALFFIVIFIRSKKQQDIFE